MLTCFCQSGLWSRQAATETFGGYKFKITGYVHWFTGVGKYDGATGRFAGELTCDQATYPASGCGNSGDYYCLNDVACAWNRGINTGAWRVHAYQVPVNTVTIQW